MSNPVDRELTKALITKQVCFNKLEPNETEILASLMVEKRFAAGDTIIKEGDPVDSFYLIANGTAEVRHITYENRQPHIEYVATLKDGDAIGLSESGFFSLSSKRTATVVAISDMLTLYLSIPEFHGFTLTYTHANKVIREQVKKTISLT
jgi:CRP-like cAMP-binding protein